MHRFITLDNKNVVISIRLGDSVVGKEIQSDVGEIGQIMQSNGTFIGSVSPLEQAQQSKIAQLNGMYQQTLVSGFNVTVNGVSYICGATAEDRGTMSATQDAINNGYVAFPFDYADIYGGKVPLTSQADFDVVKQTMAQFGFAQHKQILDLIEQVRAQTTNANGEVDVIQWTPATY